MITETLVLILLGWNAILTHKLIKIEKDKPLYETRMLQLMARTGMLRKNGKLLPRKEAIRMADDLYDMVEGNEDER